MSISYTSGLAVAIQVSTTDLEALGKASEALKFDLGDAIMHAGLQELGYNAYVGRGECETLMFGVGICGINGWGVELADVDQAKIYEATVKLLKAKERLLEIVPPELCEQVIKAFSGKANTVVYLNIW